MTSPTWAVAALLVLCHTPLAAPAQAQQDELQRRVVAKERQELGCLKSGDYDKLTETGTSHGRPFTAKVHVSALWGMRDGKWICLYSQETPAR